MKAAVLLAVAAFASAGCLGGLLDDDGDGFTDPGPEAAIGHGPDHDHSDPAQHRHARAAELLDQDDLVRFGVADGVVVGAHAMDIHGDILVVAAFGSHNDAGGQQGFHVFDVSEPERLRHLSFYDAGLAVRGDRTIALSDDGTTVFLGYEAGERPGVAAVDISDPTAPQEIGFWDDPEGSGPHTVAAGAFGGSQYVFLLSYGVTILEWDGIGFALAGKYVTSDGLAALDAAEILAQDPQSTYVVTYLLRTLYGHDMNFYLDPDTGMPLLLVAYGYDGLKILDISAPATPVPLARYLPPKETAHRHYTHSVTAERIGEDLIVVVGTETFEPANQVIPSPLWVLDATEAIVDGDPLGEPTVLSRWDNPSGAPAESLTTSLHFFRQLDGFMYLSHYHGGVWAFDLRTPEARADVEAFGYIMPVDDTPTAAHDDCCIGFALAGVPMVFDVVVGDDHTVYAADITQGVSSIRFERPAPS